MSKQGNRKAAAHGGAKVPVSAHPAFPAIVALWFAALFGIGSLVLPVALFERTAEATGLASVFPAAQAPLGVTARILVALVAAAVGAVAGIEIARKVAASATPRPVARRAAALRQSAGGAARSAKRPISAHEELGFDGLGESGDTGGTDDDAIDQPAGRRRALAVTEESAPSEFLDFAPLPGNDVAAPPAPLDLAGFSQDEGTDAFAPSFERFGTGSLSAAPPADGRQVFVPQAEPVDARANDRPFSPPHAHAAFEEHAGDAAEPRAAQIEDRDMTQTFHRAPAPAADAAATAATPASDAPPLAQLVERFARALETHRAYPPAASAAPAVPPHVLHAAPAPFAPFAVDVPPAAHAPAPAPAPIAAADSEPFAFTPAPPPFGEVPLALRPIAFDEAAPDAEDGLPDLDLTTAFSRANHAFAVAAPEPEPEPEAEEDAAFDEAYSSLLAMKNPASLPREAVRIEDDADFGTDAVPEPVVVFPGQGTRRAPAPFAADEGAPADSAGFAPSRPFDAPRDRIDALGQSGASFAPQRPAAAGDTERALREALEKLQRMSGAA